MDLGEQTSAVKAAISDVRSALKSIDENLAHIKVDAPDFADQAPFVKVEKAALAWSQGKKSAVNSFADDVKALKEYPGEAIKHLKLLGGFEAINKDHKVAKLDDVPQPKRAEFAPQFKKSWDGLGLVKAYHTFSMTSSGPKGGVDLAELKTAIDDVEKTFQDYQSGK